jgi:diguanylate cyclase (GGDEF)-like protein
MNNQKHTILIVDDTESNIDILLELLGQEYDILVSLDGKNALSIIENESIDLILLDIMMPEIDGYEVCRILKSQASTEDIPVIFITAKTDEDSIEMAYEVGGIDYVTKPFKPRELTARVKTQLKLIDTLRHLDRMASYDEMTGIYNRRKFFELSIERFESSKERLFAVMIDIDKFKTINDRYGHPFGDKVIKLITRTIATYLSKDAIFGRIGGEEFAILCNSKSKELIIELIEKIRSEIENLDIFTDSNEIVKATISEGIAQKRESITSLDTLLKEADIALYKAKGEGRNRVIFR